MYKVELRNGLVHDLPQLYGQLPKKLGLYRRLRYIWDLLPRLCTFFGHRFERELKCSVMNFGGRGFLLLPKIYLAEGRLTPKMYPKNVHSRGYSKYGERRLMRFIFNFIFFGILFYLIYLFFPEAFHVLVSWADTIYQFLRDLFVLIYKKVEEVRHSSSPAAPAALYSMLTVLIG